MEKLPEHKILVFEPNLIQLIRMEYNLDKPGQMDAAIDLLDGWIRKQAHFTKTDFPREYLERSIIFAKGSVERAKLHMDKLVTMKTSMPYFFEKINAKTDFEDLSDFFVHAPLPKLTNDKYRIYAGKLIRDGCTTRHFTLTYSFISLFLDHMKLNDYCSGFVIILDYRDKNILELITKINIMEMTQFMGFVTEGHQMRIKGFHFLTPSKAVDMVVRIFKQALSKKVGDRIQVHTTLESLHQCIPKHLLPEEFDGELKSLVDLNKDWVDVLSTEQNIKEMKEINEAKVDEKQRNGVAKNNTDLLGMPGSFRALVVD